VEKQTISSIWEYFLMDLGFCCLIFSITQMNTLKRFFSTWIFVQLGKISYGLYVYHMLAYALTSIALTRMMTHLNTGLSIFNFETLSLLNLMIGFIVTVGISLISYHCFEKLFLKLKRRFTAVESRPL
jgi:peptidoglycan/LPS O-acetylase OafA/YrhL